MPRNKGPQVDKAYEYIKEEIMTFKLAPGAEVSDYRLEQQLEMSRSPIREAMMRLKADGLIETIDNKTIVAPMNLKDIIEICQVRKAIELAAIEIIFENGKLDQHLLGALAKLMEGMKRETDLGRNYALDDQFHNLILEAAANGRMLQIANTMRLQISRARWLNVFIPTRLDSANAEHEAIYKALTEKDMQRARAAMEMHLNNSTASFQSALGNPLLNSQFLKGIATMVSDSDPE